MPTKRITCNRCFLPEPRQAFYQTCDRHPTNNKQSCTLGTKQPNTRVESPYPHPWCLRPGCPCVVKHHKSTRGRRVVAAQGTKPPEETFHLPSASPGEACSRRRACTRTSAAGSRRPRPGGGASSSRSISSKEIRQSKVSLMGMLGHGVHLKRVHGEPWCTFKKECISIGNLQVCFDKQQIQLTCIVVKKPM
jgi:hypothetical protein